MKLKLNADLSEFMKAVQACERDVFFVSSSGDRLNLKSALSQFLFSVIHENSTIMADAIIECMLNEDIEHLKPFLKE